MDQTSELDIDMAVRYYFIALIDHPFQPGKRIPPIASMAALERRNKEGEDVSAWIGVPDGVRRSTVGLDADTAICMITAEINDLDEIEKSGAIKLIDLTKDVISQVKSAGDLIKYGALATDDAQTAIRKVCKGVEPDLELFFDNQKNSRGDSQSPRQVRSP